mgnify:FL=1|jgi:hypothetical protein
MKPAGKVVFMWGERACFSLLGEKGSLTSRIKCNDADAKC